MFWKNKPIKHMTTWKGERQTEIMTHCKYNQELTQINFQSFQEICKSHEETIYDMVIAALIIIGKNGNLSVQHQ